MLKGGCKVCNRWFDFADKSDDSLWADHIRLEDCTLSDKKLGYTTDRTTKISKRLEPFKYERAMGTLSIKFKNRDGSTSNTEMESY